VEVWVFNAAPHFQTFLFLFFTKTFTLPDFHTSILSSSAVQQFQKKAVLLQGGCFEKRTTTVSKPGSAD
jgi:hypothetical protein